jgi:hypothetical protein
MIAKQKASPNRIGRQTEIVAKQKWAPNKNGRQTKMVVEPKWSPAQMVAKPKWSPFKILKILGVAGISKKVCKDSYDIFIKSLGSKIF